MIVDAMTTSTDALIADSAARLFSKVDAATRQRAEGGAFDAALWQRVADGGFPRMLATESAGGLALAWRAAFPVLRGIGYWQLPLPLAETMVAALLASVAGIDVPDGALTLIEQGRGNHLEVTGSADGPVLSGVAHAVPWARHAAAALVSLEDGRLARLDLGAAHPGVSVQAHLNLAGAPSDTLVLRDARCALARPNPLALPEPVWLLGAVARSAMLVGALESALGHALSHAGTRVQFGKRIGSFQAIQQNLALFAGDVVAARMAALVALADAPDAAAADPGAAGADPRCAEFSAAVAKVRAGEAATRGSAIAHQVHGAMGFTQEHPLHLATRRLWAWRAEFGTDAHWAGVLGRAAIKARAAAFWPSITNRHFP